MIPNRTVSRNWRTHPESNRGASAFSTIARRNSESGKGAPLTFRLSLRAIQPLPETDLKCLGGICDAEVEWTQVVHYFRATRIPHALLVNFGRPTLQYDTFDLDRLPYATSTETPNPCGGAAAPDISCQLEGGSIGRSTGGTLVEPI
ncbi:MAG: hypothetical protein IJH50_03850 [Kiritimatiellae bacterium]|nr:hypothetical protein [Kiritimatiellia bacterium]